MISKVLAVSAVVAAALTVTMSAGAVPCCFTNGSFESDNLNGWSTNLTAGFAETLPGGAPGGGSFHARIGTGNSAEGAWQSISQNSYGPAGWLRVWVRNNGEDCGYDSAQVLVDDTVVWSASCFTDWVRVGGYVTSGWHTLTVRIAHGGGDNLFASTVDADLAHRDVRFAPAP